MTIRTTHLPACAVLVAALALAPAVHAQQARTGDSAAPGATTTAPSATAPATTTTTPSATTTPGARTGSEARTERRAEDGERRNEIVEFSALESGSNSFTEGQARSRMEDAGITNVGELRRDDRGFWVGRGTRGGSQTDVAMDFRGRIAVGTGIAAMSPAGTGTTAGTADRSTTTGTATAPNDGRAAVGTTSARPDGTPGNPPGTAATRALDRAAGTNTSGAFPQNSDGTPNNPPGTAAGRAVDRATGSNTTGANPQSGATPTR
ncbi:hypothetical protein [Sabulicella rubraurantiaca]|uniref:hypothetical protein n=1 Tax=Sabulicella rubraurantiaca TaxID=2811429 RepID=UPI001F37838C|nr:hypothetical protein [Sabulicella rubraurantiaca]